MKIVRIIKNSDFRCDEFTSWEDEDWVFHGTGIDVFYNGHWMPQYEFTSGRWPSIVANTRRTYTINIRRS